MLERIMRKKSPDPDSLPALLDSYRASLATRKMGPLGEAIEDREQVETIADRKALAEELRRVVAEKEKTVPGLTAAVDAARRDRELAAKALEAKDRVWEQARVRRSEQVAAFDRREGELRKALVNNAPTWLKNFRQWLLDEADRVRHTQSIRNDEDTSSLTVGRRSVVIMSLWRATETFLLLPTSEAIENAIRSHKATQPAVASEQPE